MRDRDRPVARTTDGQGRDGAIALTIWGPEHRATAEVWTERDGSVVLGVRQGNEYPRILLTLTPGSAHEIADALRAKGAEGTRIETDRLPSKVFDDAHRFDKGGGPR
jgi:hypothetical protein